MKNTRPKQVTIHHLQRRAVVYRRSAVCPTSSSDRQIAQRDFAIGWGWPIDNIKIVDDDGAPSGLDASRAGYQQLIHMIKQGQVGLVLVSDLARLSRSSAELERFLDLCRSTDILLAVNGVILPRDENEQFADQLLQCITVFEKRLRARRRRTRQRPAANKRSNGNQS